MAFVISIASFLPLRAPDHGAPELRLNAMRELAVWAKTTEHAERALQHGKMKFVSLPQAALASFGVSPAQRRF